MAYCEVEDLLTGSIPTPGYLNPQKFVDDASDEIDSHIGFVYETPIDISDTSEVVRPARLLLKRINVFLATGRLLMAAASSAEDNSLHAYGKSLVDSANASILQISEGVIPIDGAPEINPSDEDTHAGPMISNHDVESAVDAFYDQLMTPNYAGSRVNGPYQPLVEREYYPNGVGTWAEQQ